MPCSCTAGLACCPCWLTLRCCVVLRLPCSTGTYQVDPLLGQLNCRRNPYDGVGYVRGPCSALNLGDPCYTVTEGYLVRGHPCSPLRGGPRSAEGAACILP